MKKSRKRRVSMRKVYRLVRNLVLVMIIGMIFAGSFRVKALASGRDDVPAASVQENVYTPQVEKVYCSIEVQKGDTLWEIAKRYCSVDTAEAIGAYVEELKAMNNIDDVHKLRAGAYLIVYMNVPVR